MFILERAISIIAPHVCIGCGQEGAVVCDWCLPDIASSLPSRCYRCKAQTDNGLVCRSCRRTSRLKHVWVRTSYEGSAKQLVHDFKFVRKQAAARQLALLTAECLPYLSSDTVITHIPTAPNRIRQRGYDHARLLVKAVAKECKLPYTSLLARTGRVRQVGATREKRLKQMEGVFRAKKGKIPKNAPILLVDDIVTTGGTLESAARCLWKAGVKQVDAAVFAQKQ